MAIKNDEDLAKAVREYDRLKEAAPGTPEARRRDELGAEIQAYYASNSGDMRVGRATFD